MSSPAAPPPPSSQNIFNLLPLLLLANPTKIPAYHTLLALKGPPAYDIPTLFRLTLSMQTPLSPSTLCNNEFPACAAMTTGYVFRVENPATVHFLQRTGRTGCLTTLKVAEHENRDSMTKSLLVLLFLLVFFTSMNYGLIPNLTLYANWSLALLFLSRLLSTISLRARMIGDGKWHGAKEPRVRGDLLVLMSEDRWIRIKGLVDDLKAVTSGAWLSTPASHLAFFDAMDCISRMMVWTAVIVLGSAPDMEKFWVVGGVMLGHAVVMLENAWTRELRLNGRRVWVSREEGAEKRYARRLDMARELVKESGRSDWATKLGMINRDEENEGKELGRDKTGEDIVTM
jgi:hypothetical protein